MKILGKKLVGFPIYDRTEVTDSILKSSEAQAIFADLLQKKNQPVEESEKKAREILEELTSNYNSGALKLCYWIVRLLQNFMFKDAITYGDEVKQIHELTDQGKIMFYLPNHKSHMDYLLLSYILFNHNIAPPHIAAGVNLSFFPVGWLFRNTGAYFIRRKIAGNFLYTKFLELYFDWMLKEKISQEFYMEGGRSRDGKIREAQSGIFTLFVEQIQKRGLSDQVYLVPTSITYDRLPEMRSLMNELKGAEKVKESAFSLLRSLSVLWSPHRNVHIQFGKPIQLSSLLSGDLTKQKFQSLSHYIFHRVQLQKTINDASLMALVLLSSTDSINVKEVLTRVEWLMQYLKPCRQCISEDLANIQKDWNKILARYEKRGWYEIAGSKLKINSNKRLEMNYYKNDLFPALVPFFAFADEHTQHLLHHEFPYASDKAWSFRMDDADREFLLNVAAPLIRFYDLVSKEITRKNLTSLANKEVHNQILKSLRSEHSNFEFPEMMNIESVKSASLYFHSDRSKSLF